MRARLVSAWQNLRATDLKKLAGRLCIPEIGWHTFRRTFGTIYLQNGGSIVDLQEIFGHTDIRTTLRYLGKNIDEIVDNHDRLTPLSNVDQHRRRSLRQNRSVERIGDSLFGGSRQRGKNVMSQHEIRSLGVDVQHRRRDRAVPHDPLEVGDVAAIPNEQSAEGMPEQMPVQSNPHFFADVLQVPVGISLGHRCAI